MKMMIHLSVFGEILAWALFIETWVGMCYVRRFCYLNRDHFV